MTLGLVLGTIAIVVAVVVIGVLVDRKLALLPRPRALAEAGTRKPPTHGAGEAPATAIRAGDSQVERLRASQRCTACRTLMEPSEGESVRYGEHELVAIPLRCPSCGAKRSLYVHLRA